MKSTASMIIINKFLISGCDIVLLSKIIYDLLNIALAVIMEAFAKNELLPRNYYVKGVKASKADYQT